MEVKIYREKENEALLIDDNQLQRYNELIKDLGMPEVKENSKPSVYQPLNSAMQRQLITLCPMVVDAFEYNYSTIPVEVLEVLDYCKKNNVFDGYQIWYDDKDPDPLLIGWNWMDEEAKKKDYTWKKNRSLIARWGDCALEMPELLQKGSDRIKLILTDMFMEHKTIVNNVLDNPDLYVRKILSSDTSFLHKGNNNLTKTIY